jgi:hypothetical protein
MRAWDITRFVICISATIGIINGLVYTGGVGLGGELTEVQTEYTSYEISDIRDIDGGSTTDVSIGDYYDAVSGLVLSSVMMVVHITCAIVCLIPYLIVVFGLDLNPLVTIPFQALLYYEYYMGIAQWRARTGVGMMQ